MTFYCWHSSWHGRRSFLCSLSLVAKCNVIVCFACKMLLFWSLRLFNNCLCFLCFAGAFISLFACLYSCFWEKSLFCLCFFDLCFVFARYGVIFALFCDFYKKLVKALFVKLLIKMATGCLYVWSGIYL